MIQTSESSVSYNGNNSIVTPYPVPFMFHNDEDLVVIYVSPEGPYRAILGTDYTVSGKGNASGGGVTTLWEVEDTVKVSISRNVPYTQLTSYEEGDAFPAKSHEKALDKLTMEVQQLSRGSGDGTGSDATDVGRNFRVTDASVGFPSIAKIDDAMLGVDTAGNQVLRTAGDMLSWLGQVGTAWADDDERAGTRGAYPGQLGVQLDNRTIYIATSIEPGAWVPFLIGTGIIVAHNGTPAVTPEPAGLVVGTVESQVLYNKTLESPAINNPTGLDPTDVGLENVDDVADLDKPVSGPQQEALDLKEDKASKGLASGYASLDAGGKVPTSQLPPSLTGSVQFQGTWNAATNTPAIPPAATGNKGYYYIVGVAGTTNIDGNNSWTVGDQLISNGTVWQKMTASGAVTSVNTKTGAVVVDKNDVLLGNVDNTSDSTKNSAVATLTNKTISGADNTLNVRLNTTDVSGNLPTNKLNSGTGADGTTWWCGDGSWKRPPGTGDVAGPAASTENEIVLYSGLTGKILKRFGGPAGIPRLSAAGVVTADPKIHGADVHNDFFTEPPVKVPEINDRFIYYDVVGERPVATDFKTMVPLPRNYLTGYRISFSGDVDNDVNFGLGACRDDTDQANIIAPAMVKRLDALWEPGSDKGGRDSSAYTDGTWWNGFVIYDPTANVSDYIFSRSNNPTLPAGFVYKRRLFTSAIINNKKWLTFHHQDDEFQFSALHWNDAGLGNGTVYDIGVYNPGAQLGRHVMSKIWLQTLATAGLAHVQISGANDYVYSNMPREGWYGWVHATMLPRVISANSFRFSTYCSAGYVRAWFFCRGWIDCRGTDGVYP